MRVLNIFRAFISDVDDALHFLIDVHGGGFAEVAMLGNFAAQENRFFLFAERQWPKLAHAPFADHVARDVGSAFDVVSGASGDVPEEHFFRGAAAHQHRQHTFQMFFGVGMLIVGRQLHGQAERHAARNNRNFVHRVGARSHRRHNGVSRFVIRGVFLFFVRQDQGFAFHSHQDFVLGHFEVGHQDEFAILARRPQSGFVGQAFEIGAGESRRAPRDDREIHIVRNWLFPCMHAKNLFAALYVWSSYNYAAIKSSRTQQCWIEHVWPVSSGDQDDALVRFESIHFHQQGIQGLFAFVVATAQSGAAVPSDRVNFVNENDAGRILLALFEQIAHSARADADKHFHEVRTGNREKRHIGFARDGPRQQGFARSRRPDKQHAFRDAPAQLLKLLRILQKFNNFLQLFLGFVGSRYVFERNFLLLRGKQARPRLSKTQRFISARLHLPHKEHAETHQQQQRHLVQENDQPIAAAHLLHIYRHLLVAKLLGQVWRVFLEDGRAEFLVGGLRVLALHLIAVGRQVHGHFFDVALLHVHHELAVAGRIFTRGLPVCRDQPPEHYAKQHDG